MSHRIWYAVGALAVLATALFLYRTEMPLAIASFGNTSLIVEYVTDEAAQERGLGGRDVVPEHYGMLFAFTVDDTYGFWMKDMRVPIDIFWLDSQGQVVSMRRNLATSTYPHVFYPVVPARYVLETAAGFADTYGVATGTPLKLKNLKRVSE